MDDKENQTEVTTAQELVVKKYTSKTGIKKVHRKELKRLKQGHRQKSKKYVKQDIIPINKSKKRSVLFGGNNSPNTLIGGKKENKTATKTPTAASSSTPEKHGLPHPLQMDVEYIKTQNMNKKFNKLAKQKKSVINGVFFDKKSLEGQATYLEYLYYLLMYHRGRVYRHINPKISKKSLLDKYRDKKLIEIFQSNTTAFNLHMPNGIQIADFSTLSVGTTKEIYYDLVYSLSMMKKNERANFLSGCDKKIIRFFQSVGENVGEKIKKTLITTLEVSKAVAQVGSLIKTRSGLKNFKKIYDDVFNGNDTLSFSSVAVDKHQDKLGFICALYRFRRDQLKYNYYLDKFIVRMKTLFNTPDSQLAILSGNHSMLYNGDKTKMNLYSINAIIQINELTKLSKFKSNADLPTNIKTDDITKEIQSKLNELAKKLGMGNYHYLYEVIGSSKKIYYEYKTEGDKEVKILKDVFRYQGGDTKKEEKIPDAQYIALAYRIYHMLYHLYPNVARIMNTQDEWLKIYGLPKFDELSYHKKKFKALRKKKNFESDYYRFAQSLNTISADMNQDITQLMAFIDNAVGLSENTDNENTIKYRHIIAYLDKMDNKVKDMNEGELRTLKQLFDSPPKKPDNDDDILQELNFSKTNKLEEVIAYHESIRRNPAKSIIQEYIQRLKKYYQKKLKDVAGMSRPIKGTPDDKKKIYNALGIPETMLGGGEPDEVEPVPDWDGTDESLDIIQEYEKQNAIQNRVQQHGGAQITPKTIDTTDGKTLYYYNFNEKDLEKYWSIIIDFINSPHFIESGGFFDKMRHKLSLKSKDTGTGKGVGQESLYMELNFFSYLIKLEMGVINYDDDSGDSKIPLGTNLNRVTCGVPLFYETYLVNHFTNIFETKFIEQNNYSRIGYILASTKDKSKTMNKLLYDTKQLMIFNEQTEPTKCAILKKQFRDASFANTDKTARKIPFTLLELASMTPEELLSLSSLASNAELSKIINTKVENTMNQKLSKDIYLKPLKTFIEDLYGKDYYFGRTFDIAIEKYKGLSALLKQYADMLSQPTKPSIAQIYNKNLQIAMYIEKYYFTTEQTNIVAETNIAEVNAYLNKLTNPMIKDAIILVHGLNLLANPPVNKITATKLEDIRFTEADAKMLLNEDKMIFGIVDAQQKYPKFFAFNDNNKAKKLKALTSIFKFVLYSTEFQDKTKSRISQFINVTSKIIGIGLFASLISGGILAIPAGLYIPWILSDIYKYNSFDSAWNAFVDLVSKESSSGFSWANMKQIFGETWDMRDARTIWKELNTDEREFIKYEAHGLYTVFRDLKMNMFYTSMVKDEIDAKDSKVNATTILQNLTYIGILSPTHTKIKRTYLSIPAIPFFSGSYRLFEKTSGTITMCSYILNEYLYRAEKQSKPEEALIMFAIAFLIWQFTGTKKYEDIIFEIKNNPDSTKTGVIKNIFTDSETDEYGMQLFEKLKQKNDHDILTLFNTMNFNPGSSGEKRTVQEIKSSAFGKEEKEEVIVGGGIFTFTGAAIYTIADFVGLPEIFGSMWDSVKNVPNKIGAFFNTSYAKNQKFVETMNLLLGLHKYVECIKIFGDNLEYVNESITRTENLLTRKSKSGDVSTIKSELVKTEYNDFAALLLNGSFNGLLTSSISMIGETGVINLIQYYRNIIMDIMNTEPTLQVVTGDKETVRIKYNKVLTKILVYLRLNAIFTDYVLMNKDILYYVEDGYSITDNINYLALLGYKEEDETVSISRSSSVSTVRSHEEEEASAYKTMTVASKEEHIYNQPKYIPPQYELPSARGEPELYETLPFSGTSTSSSISSSKAPTTALITKPQETKTVIPEKTTILYPLTESKPIVEAKPVNLTLYPLTISSSNP